MLILFFFTIYTDKVQLQLWLQVYHLQFGIFGVAAIISYHLSIMTTIALVRKNNEVVWAGDGQVSMRNTAVKSTASKIGRIEKRDVIYYK